MTLAPLFLASDAKSRILAMLALRSPGLQEIWVAATFMIWEVPSRHGESEPDWQCQLAKAFGVNCRYPSVTFYQACRSGVFLATILPR